MSININTSVANTNRTHAAPNRTIKYIVIHYTATPDSYGNKRAFTVANGFAHNDREASADFIVDDTTIVQYNPDIKNRATWHCGGDPLPGFNKQNDCTNTNSIGIEMCSSTTTRQVYAQANIPQWYFTEAVLNLTIELVKYLMATYNIPQTNVIRHYDVTGTSCPGVIGWNPASGDESKWLNFKSKLIEGTNTPKPEEVQPEPPYAARIIDATVNSYENKDENSTLLRTYQYNDVVAIIEKDGEWGKTQKGWIKISSTVPTTGITQTILDYIMADFVEPKFDENAGTVYFPMEGWLTLNDNYEYEVKNQIVAALLAIREQEVQQDSTNTIINNNNFVKSLVLPFNNSSSVEDYENKVKLLLKESYDTERKLAPSPYSNILIQTKEYALTDISDKEIQNKIESEPEDILNYYKNNFNEKGWNKIIEEAPETLNFWFDFMETNGEMGKYAVQVIGSRSKAVNNDKVKAIYFQETPSVLFLTKQDQEELKKNPENYMDMTGYTFIGLTPQMENYFTISGQGKSAKDELDSLLYKHTYATDSTTLTAVPIYHLQPNTRVFVKDKNTGINGEYIISKITVPLQYNGTSSITTTKAVERIY